MCYLNLFYYVRHTANHWLYLKLHTQLNGEVGIGVLIASAERNLLKSPFEVS